MSVLNNKVKTNKPEDFKTGRHVSFIYVFILVLRYNLHLFLDMYEKLKTPEKEKTDSNNVWQ